MFKHPKCGGSHQTVSEARACEQQPAGTRSLTSVQTMERQPQPAKHTPAQSAILASLRGHGERAAERRGYGLATSTTSRPTGYSINGPRYSGGAQPQYATPNAEKYARDLLRKKDWQGRLTAEEMRTVELLTEAESVPASACSALIKALQPLEYKQAAPASAPTSPAPQGRERSNSGRIQELKAQVPDGRYAVDLPDGDKLKFFSVRTRKGYITIKHCVSDARYPWPFNRYEEVLEAIIAATPAAAGQRYAEEYGACYRCGRSLTDTTGNPYKAIGLGPECGAK